MKAHTLVAEVCRRDLKHVRGFSFSDNPHSLQMMNALRDEVKELDDALALREAWRGMPEFGGSGRESDKVRKELADVLVCVLQIAYREGLSFEALDAAAVEKIRDRFVGAKEIVLEAA